MRYRLAAYLAAAVLLVLLVPVLVLELAPTPRARPGEPSLTVTVYDNATRRILHLSLEEYVADVVAAEMPSTFPMAALEAQAVAARSFTVYHLRSQGGPGCPGVAADVCTDPADHGQAWIDRSTLQRLWGLSYVERWSRIVTAVNATAGQVLTYRGQVIDAVYSSTAGDPTESASAVWGQAVPYLVSVPNPYEADSPYHRVVTTVSAYTLAGDLHVLVRSLLATGLSAVRDPSGRVVTITGGYHRFSGEQFRVQVGLRSRDFTWTQHGSQFQFVTSAWGHGVGLSQYGAAGMAKLGYTYVQILCHYYTGVAVSLLDPR